MMKKLLVLLLLVSAIASASAQYQRRVLVEEFTNASCPPCAAQNPAFNVLLANEDAKVTPIKYQTNWPGVDPMNAQNPTDVATRVSYYGVSGVPNGFVDGAGITNDCGYYDNAPACLNAAEIDARYTTTSPVNIVVSHTISADYDSILISVSVTSAEALTGALRLHVAVVEEEIVFDQQPGTNGELDFYQVMRKMLPNGGGTTTGDFAAGETKTYTMGWPVLYCYDLNHIGVSAWLQNNTGKIVYNSARSVGAGTAAASGMSFVSSMPAFICAAGSNPYFTLTNSGTEALTSAQMWYKVDAGAWTEFSWTGNLAPGASEVVTLSAVSVTANTNIQIVGVSSNNGAHLNRTDGINLSIKVLSPTASPLPFANTFQSAAFPPTSWNIANAGTNGWKLATNAGSQGSTRSAKNNMFDYDAADTELVSPKVDLTQSSGTTTLVFDHAYAYYSAAFFDSLRVDISSDCGATWTTLFHDGKDGLATAPVTTGAFTPTANQWENHVIDISSFNGSEVVIRFVAESGYGNNAYIDNVNVTTAVGVKNLDLTRFILNPNPTKDRAELRFGLDQAQNIQLLVFDAMGSLVQSRDLGQLTSGDHIVDLDAVRLSSGSYRVVLQGAQGVAQTQWIVLK